MAGPYFYSCEHGESNTPDLCHLRAWALTSKPGDPPPAEMPENWHETYKPPGIPGQMTDSVSFGSSTPPPDQPTL